MATVVNFLQGAMKRLRKFAYAEAERGPTRRPRIGLSLSGGFAWGIAHLGVLQVLQEAQIPIDCIAGTSVGALVAAAYASGVSLEKMEQQAKLTHFNDFGRWTISFMGLATNSRMESYLRRYSEMTSFEEMKTPLAIAATDLNTGEAVYFTRGPLGPALRASCAYPGLFLPVDHQGHTLVDGFLATPVPVDAVRQLGAECVIAVHLEASSADKPRNMIDVIARSFNILQRYAHQDWRDRADVIIEPEVKGLAWDAFERTPEMIAAGAAATRRMLPHIHALLGTPPLRIADQGA